RASGRRRSRRRSAAARTGQSHARTPWRGRYRDGPPGETQAVRRVGAVQKEALAHLAMQLASERELAVAFDPHGDRSEARFVSQRDDRGNHGARLAVILEAVDEGTVELEHVQRQVAREAQR